MKLPCETVLLRYFGQNRHGIKLEGCAAPVCRVGRLGREIALRLSLSGLLIPIRGAGMI
jgi:hypothetical protein